jgi:5-methylcytosine-specific restriction protein A
VSITQVTRAAILAAIAEHDRDPEAFKRHGFGAARTYFLIHEGRKYDSKAIVGAAHGHLAGKTPLSPSEFSGGEKTVAALLRSLGFEVRIVRSPAWLHAELVLACDLVARNGWKGIRAHEERAIELSAILQQLPLHPPESRSADFRTPNSVQRKTFDIATQHPDYRGKQTKGGKLDKEILKAFLERPDEMTEEAAAIRAGIASGEFTELPPAADVDEEEAAAEGRVLVLRHLRRERDPRLRAKKIREVLSKRGRLECEVCVFDFELVYGERGAGFAEIHHVTPLHVSGETETHLADLAVLCANCHRMIHRGRDWLTPPELRGLVEQRRRAG